MGEQRQLFRFRLPWLSSAAPTPRPAAALRPAAEPQPRPQAASQPTTTIPIQRPPFRPAGIAPVQTTPTQAQQQKTEPRPASPPRLTSSQPSSPSRRATPVQTLSPPKKLPTVTSTQTPSSASRETTFKPFGVAVKPSEASAQVKEVAAVTMAAAEAPSAPAKPKGREERKKVAEEHRKGAIESSIHEEPEHRTITKHLPTTTEAGTKTRELMETGKKQQVKQEDIERKKTWTTSSTDEKQIKTVSSTYQKDGSIGQPKEITSKLEKVPLHKEIREDISKFVHQLATGQPKLLTDEKPISVLTLAGENRGASFCLGSESTKKDGSVHIHRGYKLNPDDSPDATTDGEGSSSARKPKDSITKENPAPTAYVNSNTQSINNSFVSESSVNERNPGVLLEFLQDLGESTKSSAKAEPTETRKAEFNITPAEKLTYEPTVRRRCLRGLFAEPSDSDPDNPEKPRRHGCRYSCGQKNKEKEIGVL
ncbi:hypothetical protein DITRI_Ditri03aG0207100 [Diplodiscus trichospermus]